MAMSEPTQPLAGAPAAAAKARTSFGILGAISLSHLLNDMIQSLILAIYPLLQAEFSLTFVQIGLITLTFQLASSLLQPVVGYWTDKYPMPWSLPVGMCFTLSGLVLLAMAGSFGGVLLAAALVGTGSSVFHPESSRVARMASGGRHGLAQSIFQVGGNFGSSLGPLLAAVIIAPYGKGNVAWFVLAALLAIVVLAQISRWYAAQHRIAKGKPKAIIANPLPRNKVVLAVSVLLLLIFSKYFYMASISSYYTFYLMQKFGLSIQNAQLHLFAFLFAVAAGTVIGGPVGDKIGRKYVIWGSILGVAPFTLVLPYATLYWTGILTVIIEIKAAAICGADMKHYNVDSGSDEFNSVRGHEFAGRIARVGEKVKDWKVGQRVVSDNSGHVCGVCPACEQGDFLCCTEKVNLGLDNNTWGGGFSKYCLVPGEILKIHRHALWEIPEGVDYEEAAVLDPICNAYKSIAQQSKFLPGQDVVVIGTGPLGLFSVQMARIMGAVNIVVVGLDEDVPVRFPVAKELGATAFVNGSTEDVVARCREICGKDNLGLVIECSGANIALKQAIDMLRPNGEVVRVGMGFKPLDFSINDITSWNKSIIGHMAYDSTSWRNAIRLLASGAIKVKPMITHRIGLSQWREGFDAMVDKTAIKVIMTYDFDE
ncbi:TPA: MFS transporter [Salmonella enterica subsp. enterica serovar Enteritidis]|nr:MFS transporter [Salmonella enterica subsp. enterica serovar Enteritidis]